MADDLTQSERANLEDRAPSTDSDSVKSGTTTTDDTPPYAEDAPMKAASQEDGTVATPSSATVASDSNIPKYVPTPNFLHGYASYTYNLSLHALPIDDYNKIILAKNKDAATLYKPTNVLIAGAGKYSDTFPRNKNFKADFYFDEFKMTTIIGANSRTRMTNAIDINFTIIEPYGVTLLNRIIVTSKELKCDNYVAMPYLLQLDFYGYSDDGTPTKIPGVSKFFPIKIIAMKFKVSTKGATYQVQAIPFNHQGYSDTAVTCPANFVVEGISIGDFFDSDDLASDLTSAKSNITEQKNTYDALSAEKLLLSAQRNALANLKRESDTSCTPGDLAREDTIKMAIAETEGRIKIAESNNKTAQSRQVRVKSYTNGFNTWLRSLENTKQQVYADRIEFDIDNDIRASKLTEVSTQQSQNSAMNYEKGAQEATTGPVTGTKGVAISMGKSTIDVIVQAITNSSYIRDQLTDPLYKEVSITDAGLTDVAKKLGQAIDWYKVTATIELGKYDHLRKEYSKKITYHITKAPLYNTTDPLAPHGLPHGVAKEYQYMFTGKNHDILDFDIDFDAAYYVAVSADRINANAGMIQQKDGVEPEASDGKSQVAVAQLKNDRPSDLLKPVVKSVTSQGDAAADPKQLQIKDLLRNTLTNARGDMINVKLKIIGDPDYIKQDDLFYSVRDSSSNAADHKTSNGSLIMDKGDIHAYLLFKTPTDYNEQGLATPEENSLFSTSVFSGVYKILTVESVFRNGAFTQTLDMIRLHDQKVPGLGPIAEEATSNSRELELELALGAANEKALDSGLLGETVTNLSRSASGAISSAKDAVMGQLPTGMIKEAGIMLSDTKQLISGAATTVNGITSMSVPGFLSGSTQLPDLGGGLTQLSQKLPGVAMAGAGAALQQGAVNVGETVTNQWTKLTDGWKTVPISKSDDTSFI